jgi:hypothetical protein
LEGETCVSTRPAQSLSGAAYGAFPKVGVFGHPLIRLLGLLAALLPLAALTTLLALTGLRMLLLLTAALLLAATTLLPAAVLIVLILIGHV